MAKAIWLLQQTPRARLETLMVMWPLRQCCQALTRQDACALEPLGTS